jgi:transposase
VDCSVEPIVPQLPENEGKMSQPKEQKLFVGIDIAARTFAAAWGTTMPQIGRAYTFNQSKTGHQKLIQALRATGFAPEDTLVALEATGTYWMQLAVALHQAGYQVSVINPRQAHNFAEALLKQAKTDAIDACTLTQLAMTLPVKTWTPPGEVWEALYQRLVEHDSVVDTLQSLRNQLHALKQRPWVDPVVLARKQQLIDELKGQLKAIKKEIQDYLKQSEWAEMACRLQVIKGIGPLSAAWLLVVTNGFSTCEDAEQLASYLGLVPHPQQSGSSRHGYRGVGHSGHARARRVLYQAGVSAASHNPAVRDFYQRLLARGKHVKVARCAAARKLVHIAFAVVTKEQAFDPSYHLSCQLPLAA